MLPKDHHSKGKTKHLCIKQLLHECKCVLICAAPKTSNYADAKILDRAQICAILTFTDGVCFELTVRPYMGAYKPKLARDWPSQISEACFASFPRNELSGAPTPGNSGSQLMEMLQQIKQSVPFKYFTGRQHQPLMVCLGPGALNSSYSWVESQ